jgi:8-oxo-dGTP diphosphatase
MPQTAAMKRVALVLRKYPWTVAAAQWLWKQTRPKFSMGVVGVVFNGEGHILMVEHVFHPYLPWGLPGGWVERNEDPARSLRRELREELALDVEVGPIVALENVRGTHVDVAYLCYPNGQVGSLCYELLDYEWVDPTQLPRTHLFHHKAIQRAQEIRLLETRI